MDKLTAIEADLSKAREALITLQDELPQFHALLSENEAEQARLKSERAPLDKQAQARGRVQIAREMLEQHQSDIATARGEVDRLEASKNRGLTLAKMATHAKNATKHRETLDKVVLEVSAVLGRALEQMDAAFAGIREERQAFALQGLELAPGFTGKTPYGNDIREEGRRAVAEAVMNEVEATGADLTDVLDLATGRHSPLDRKSKPLPTPEHAALLWQAFHEAVAKPQRHNFYTIHLPVKAQPIAAIPNAVAPRNLYSI